MVEGAKSRVRWLLVLWLFILSAVAYLDRINLAIAGSFIAAEFSLTNVQLGSLTSAFLLGYAFFQTLGGWLADRLGSRRVLAVGVVWWGIFTSLIAAVPPGIISAVLVLAAARFLLGAGEAVLFPASNQFVSRWIPSQERGRANGLIFAGVGIGAGATPFLFTYIMTHYGWRWSFWLSAVIGLTVGIIWYLFARNTPEEHPKVSPAELEFIQAGRTVRPSNSACTAEESNQRSVPAVDRIPWMNILS